MADNPQTSATRHRYEILKTGITKNQERLKETNARVATLVGRMASQAKAVKQIAEHLVALEEHVYGQDESG